MTTTAPPATTARQDAWSRRLRALFGARILGLVLALVLLVLGVVGVVGALAEVSAR